MTALKTTLYSESEDDVRNAELKATRKSLEEALKKIEAMEIQHSIERQEWILKTARMSVEYEKLKFELGRKVRREFVSAPWGE